MNLEEMAETVHRCRALISSTCEALTGLLGNSEYENRIDSLNLVADTLEGIGDRLMEYPDSGKAAGKPSKMEEV